MYTHPPYRMPLLSSDMMQINCGSVGCPKSLHVNIYSIFACFDVLLIQFLDAFGWAQSVVLKRLIVQKLVCKLIEQN